MEALKGKKLLILGGADVHIKLVKACQELGVYSIVTDYLQPENSPAKLIADEHWEIDINSIDELVQKCKVNSVDGVLAFCLDPAQIPYQRICEKLDLPCYGTREQFDILTNKILFKEYCRKHKVDVIPEYSMEDVKANKLSFPVLVKPSESRGSRGQTICYTLDEIYKGVKIAELESKDGKAIIEKYMDKADDMSFSYVIIDSEPYLLKIGDRYLGRKEDNLDRQQIASFLPSIHKEEFIKEVEPAVKNMIKSLGISFGAVFLQGFWQSGKCYFYDPGMRFPGSDFDIALKDATGYDNMKTFINFALTGNKKIKYGNPNKAYLLNGKSCLILSIACREGTLDKIEGLELVKKHEGLISFAQRKKEKDEIPSSGDIQQRVAEFITLLPDVKSSIRFLKYVYQNLSITDEKGQDMITSKIDINKLKN